jgi:CDP-diacylglycerol--serine O-phosphatidyltransferase
MITAFGLACGLFVIFKVNMIEPGSGYFQVMMTSSLFLLLAAFADFVDGAVARALHAESPFGVAFDSLADAISFGVAPSVLVLKSLSLQQGTVLSFLAATGVMIYSLCGVLRLVRFNVQTESAKEDQKKKDEQKKHFTGLPIPAAAAAAISLTLLLLSQYPKFIGAMEGTTRAIILSVMMVILGYFMVSRWKFPSLKFLHFRVASFHLVWLTVVIAVFIFYGFLYYFPFVLTLISWGYILLAITLTIIRKIAGRKSKTLEDFEPESDDE